MQQLLGERVDVQDVLAAEHAQHRPVVAVREHVGAPVVLEDRDAVLRAQLEHAAQLGARVRVAGRVLEARDEVRERRSLRERAVPRGEVDAGERIEVEPDDVVAERLEQQLRVRVHRRLDGDAAHRERARDDVERLLRAGRDHDLVGLDVEPARDSRLAIASRSGR